MPATTTVDRRYDNEMIATADLDINTVGFVVASERAIKQRVKSYYAPKLVTGYPPQRPQTQRQGFIALTKRNLLTVDRTDLANIDVLAEDTFSHMIRLLMHRDAAADIERYRRQSVQVTHQMFVTWVHKQPPAVVDLLLSSMDCSLNDINISNLEYFLKADTKPIVEDNKGHTIPAGQTVMYSPKVVNAIAGPFIEFTIERFIDLLGEHVMYNRGKNVGAVQDFFSKTVGRRDSYYIVEDDISAYDKSQHVYCYQIVRTVLSKMGMNTDIVERYMRGQISTKTTAINLGLQIYREYQRNSGMPDTAPFNTIVRLATIADTFAHVNRDDIYACSVLGDDMTAYTKPTQRILDATHDMPGLIASLYNLSTKVHKFGLGYFCGYYLVPMDHQIYLMADPIRRAIKLGRRDVADESKFKELYISFSDNMINYDKQNIKESVIRAVCERYNTKPYDITALMDALSTVTASYNEFRNLFERTLTFDEILE